MKLAAVATAAGVAYALGWLTRQPEVAAARREANTDTLTRLVNRHGLKRQLRICAERGHPYTLYLLDLNGFKPVNDLLGHRAGDQLLAQLGDRLRRGLEQHLVARLGGDEFVVLERGLHLGTAATIEEIRGAVECPVRLPGSSDPVTLTAAIGFIHVPAGGDPQTAMHAADQAMYRSKVTGRPELATRLSWARVDESPRSRTRDARPVRVP